MFEFYNIAVYQNTNKLLLSLVECARVASKIQNLTETRNKHDINEDGITIRKPRYQT